MSVKDSREKLSLLTTKEFSTELSALIKSRTPLIYLVTTEERRLLNYFQTFSIANGYRTLVWDAYNGLLNLSNMKPAGLAGADNSDVALVLDLILKEKTDINDSSKGNIYILLDFHRFMSGTGGSPCSPAIERRLRTFQREDSNSVIVMVGPHFQCTPALEKSISVIDFPYPNKEELKISLYNMIDGVSAQYPTIKKDTESKEEEIIRSVSGLTLSEAENAFAKSVVVHRKIDIPTLLKEKRQIIRKTGVLEFVQSDVGTENIGGLRNLITWLKKRKVAFSEDAQNFGVRFPRGVMLMGISGCGKSLSAKAVAKEYNLPLLRLDFGALFNSLMGESERNIRQALKIAEAVAPCITGDTEIMLSDGGVQTIEQMYNSGKDNYVISTLNEETLKTETNKIKAIIKHIDKKEVLNIKTWFGNVSVTIDHKMMVNRNGNFMWVEAKNIVIGDLLLTEKYLKVNESVAKWHDLIPDNCRLFGDDIWTKYSKKLFYRDRAVRKYRRSLYIRNSEITDIKDCPQPLYINCGVGGYANSVSDMNFDVEKFYYCLGLINSNGYLTSKRYRVGFTNTEMVLHERFKNLIQEMFGLKVNTYLNKRNYICKLKGLSKNPVFKNCYNSYFTNKIVYSMFKRGMDILLRQPSNIIASYLSGYFDGDGCITVDPVGQYRLMFCSKKQKSYKNIRKCLHRIGILSAGGQKGYSVTISSDYDVKLLINILKIHHPKRKRIFNDASSAFENGHIHDVEVYDKTVNDISGHIILRELERHGEVPKIAKIIESDVIGVEVKSILSVGKQDVYDLSVVGNHNFFANGLLSKNCCVWVDEIEKGLSGINSSGKTDSGVTARVIATLLTWMQENTRPVFVVCTANQHENIPTEFLRRFDEIFFVDLPTRAERIEIFTVLLKRKNRDPKDFDISTLASASDKYTGAEAEKAIDAALLDAFADGKRALTTDDIMTALRNIKPLAVMRPEVIESMQVWAENRCVRANTTETVPGCNLDSQRPIETA